MHKEIIRPQYEYINVKRVAILVNQVTSQTAKELTIFFYKDLRPHLEAELSYKLINAIKEYLHRYDDSCKTNL